MSELYYPFATGAGALANEVAWGNIFLGMGTPGVLMDEGSELLINAPGGSAVGVGTGKVHCFGHYYELTAPTTLSVEANAGGTRFDRVVVRFDFLGDNAHVVVLKAAGAGLIATMSKDRLGFYDISLGLLVVPTGADITSGRVFPARDRWALPMQWWPPGTLLPFLSPESQIPRTCVAPAAQALLRFNYERLWNAWDAVSLAPDGSGIRLYGRIAGASRDGDYCRLPDMRGRGFVGLDTEGTGDAARLSAPDILGNGGLDINGNPLWSANIRDGDIPAHAHALSSHAFAVRNIGGGTIAGGTGTGLEVSTGFATDESTDPSFQDTKMQPGMLGNWMFVV